MNTNTKKIVQIAGISIFFILIIIYAFFRSHDLIFGVQIKNVTINDIPIETTSKINTGVVKISGNARNAINLSLNGREISIDQSGNFNETIALLLGYNVINVKARDKFSDVDEKNYKIIYEEAAL